MKGGTFTPKPERTSANFSKNPWSHFLRLSNWNKAVLVSFSRGIRKCFKGLSKLKILSSCPPVYHLEAQTLRGVGVMHVTIRNKPDRSNPGSQGLRTIVISRLPAVMIDLVDLVCDYSLCTQFSKGVSMSKTQIQRWHRYKGRKAFGIPKIWLLSIQVKNQISSLILLSLHR